MASNETHNNDLAALKLHERTRIMPKLHKPSRSMRDENSKGCFALLLEVHVSRFWGRNGDRTPAPICDRGGPPPGSP